MNKELILNMGENEDREQQKAIEFALLDQRVVSLERWKDAYEKAQQDKFERMQEENKNERLKFEEKLDKFMENISSQIADLSIRLNNQKDNWLQRPPFWVSAVFTGLISLVVYLVTKKY